MSIMCDSIKISMCSLIHDEVGYFSPNMHMLAPKLKANVLQYIAAATGQTKRPTLREQVRKLHYISCTCVMPKV